MTDGSNMDERMGRVEERLDGIDRRLDTLQSDVSVLKTDVSSLKTEVVTLKDHMLLQFEHVEDRFRVMAESVLSVREHIDRRFDEAASERRAELTFFKAVLGDHEQRLQVLERAPEARP